MWRCSSVPPLLVLWGPLKYTCSLFLLHIFCSCMLSSLSLSSAHSYTTHQKAKREILCKILVFFMTLGLQRIRIRKGLRGNEELQLQKKKKGILKYLLFMLEVMLLYLNFFLPR